ncbi:MAG: hypothetical protein POELPBGB_01111 [Bacteroidia bacterium]|nr:hypothetical protein [Bacteroidia bacterium]
MLYLLSKEFSLSSFFVSVRISNWRFSFLPYIVGICYLFLLLFEFELSISSLLNLFLFLLTSTGFAALGYFINEYFDRTSDALAGKKNYLADISNPKQVLFLLIILVLTFIPWLILPSDKWSWILIGLEITLFLAYSLPFPRLKNVWLVSAGIDTAYAYIIPFLLASHTFFLFAEKPVQPLFILFVFISFFIGYRNILLHQVKDVSFDKKSGITTFPHKTGHEHTKDIIQLCLLFEIICYVSFFIIKSVDTSTFLLIIISFLIYLLLGINKFIFSLQKSGSTWDNSYIDQFHQIYFPVLCIIVLAIRDFDWIILLPVHYYFFIPPHIRRFIKYDLLKRFKEIYIEFAIWIRWIINHIIYLSFHLFGVDLNKEKVSAFQYIKKLLLSRLL